MSNEFYVNGDTLVGGTTANAADVKAEFDNIQTGFDKLPTEAQLKSGNLNYAVDSGAANAYVVAMPQTWTAYTAGWHLTFKVTNANTGASTINVDGLGVKSIKKTDGSSLDAGDLVAGALVVLGYDGTNFQVLNAVQGVVDSAENARDAAQTAQAAAETAQTGAETAETSAINEANYAQEWAVKAEDSLISVAAGGDGSTEYSAYHWAQKAEEWASSVNIPPFSGNGGKALHLNDGGTAMEWKAPGAYHLLTEVTLSGETAVDFTFPSGYEKYIINVQGINASRIDVRTSTDGGTTFDDGANTYWSRLGYITSGDPTGYHLQSTFGLTYQVVVDAEFTIFNPGDSTQNTAILVRGTDGSSQNIYGAITRSANQSVDAIRLFRATGTFTGGTMKLYGIT